MNKTKIEWCDFSWNPITGCLHGCPYCYARRIAIRFGRSFKPALYLKLLTLVLKYGKDARMNIHRSLSS